MNRFSETFRGLATQAYEHWAHEVGWRVFTSRTLGISSRPRPHALFRSRRTLSILLKGSYWKSINGTPHKLFLCSHCIYTRHVKIWFHVYEEYGSSIQQLAWIYISYKYMSLEQLCINVIYSYELNTEEVLLYGERDTFFLSAFIYKFFRKFEIVWKNKF